MCGPIASLVSVASTRQCKSKAISLYHSSHFGKPFGVLALGFASCLKAPLPGLFVPLEAYWCNISPVFAVSGSSHTPHLLVDFTFPSDNLPDARQAPKSVDNRPTAVMIR
jgi:hypothetical protein